MDAKFPVVAVAIIVACCIAEAAALRRTPKVYNALITTDENLTGSRAYPVIQPALHEPAIAHYPFGPYSPYAFYTPPAVHFGQPLVPGLMPRQQLPYPLSKNQFLPKMVPPPQQQRQQQEQQESAADYPLPKRLSESSQSKESAEGNLISVAPSDAEQPVKPPAMIPKEPTYMPLEEEGARPLKMASERTAPLALNEYGLPPALIPLPEHQHNAGGYAAAHIPYTYNQYPLVFDSIGLADYREPPYLPHYDYYPSHSFVVSQGPYFQSNPQLSSALATAEQPVSAPVPARARAPVPVPAASAPPPVPLGSNEDNDAPTNEVPITTEAPKISLDSIKNLPKDKDNGIPDVPPPPIPSGAKAKKP